MGTPGFPLNPTLGGLPMQCGVINLQMEHGGTTVTVLVPGTWTVQRKSGWNYGIQ